MNIETIPVAAIREQCSVVIDGERCEKIVYNKTLSLCNAHNLQRLRGNEYRSLRARPTVTDYLSNDCSELGCVHPAKARGLCSAHYYQLRNGGKTRRLYEGRRAKGMTLLRDEEGRKECSRCLLWLTEDNFFSYKKALDGLKGFCKTCNTATTRERNQSLSFGERRRLNLWRYYKKTPEWFDETLRSQDNKCAACKSPEPGKKGWAMDHDHFCCPSPYSCGECVRGILCGRCNLVLGLVKDSRSTLEDLSIYLKETSGV